MAEPRTAHFRCCIGRGRLQNAPTDATHAARATMRTAAGDALADMGGKIGPKHTREIRTGGISASHHEHRQPPRRKTPREWEGKDGMGHLAG